jgi:hypothetical protein
MKDGAAGAGFAAAATAETGLLDVATTGGRAEVSTGGGAETLAAFDAWPMLGGWPMFGACAGAPKDWFCVGERLR